MKKRLQTLIWISLISLLSFLYYQSGKVDFEKVESIMDVLNHMKEADSALDEAVLKSRYYIIKNYDPINQAIRQIDSGINFFENSHLSINNSEQKILAKELQTFRSEYRKKKQEVDRFKSENSILRNALRLLPISIEKIKKENFLSPTILDNLLKQILVFNLNGEQTNKNRSQIVISKLKKISTQKKSIELEILIHHAENIITRKEKLDGIIESILTKQTKAKLDLLLTTLTLNINSFLTSANIYRLLLYSFSVTLLIFVAYTLIRLLISSIALRISHEKLLRTNKVFERFVPKESLNLLSKSSLLELKLGDSVKKEMSILFSDIRSFTSISEGMTPEENFQFINSYLNVMGPIIRQNKGFIDKYIGDAIMAIFQDNSEDPIHAAIQMQLGLQEFNQTSPLQIRIGIGIHVGPMMFGTIGENDRIESTVISDAVNLASRIEGLTKYYGVQILISEAIYDNLQDPHRYKIRYIDRVVVKGKNKAIKIFEIYDFAEPEVIEKKLLAQADFESGIEAFFAKDIEKAYEFFQKATSIFPEDPPALLWQERCKKILPLSHEPNFFENWQTATEFHSK